MNDEFVQNTISLRGDEGARWLERIPRIIQECEERWHIRVGRPFDLSYNYVAPATRIDGSPAVLKIGFPADKEFQTEIAALQVFMGEGIVRLWEVDSGNAAVLLERLEPGTPVSSLEADPDATRAIAGVMKNLWKPAPARHNFPSVADWFRGFQRLRERFDGTSGPLPAKVVDAAEATFADLLNTQSEHYLLHGDLHHGNVLSATRAPWLAIDPKGVIGERAYETAAMLRNPYPDVLRRPNVSAILASRIDQLSEELSLDRERIRRWGFAQTVLSAIWSVEDHGSGWEYDIAVAELIAAMKDI